MFHALFGVKTLSGTLLPPAYSKRGPRVARYALACETFGLTLADLFALARDGITKPRNPATTL